MNLTLSGHDYKYAVEQILLMMYPHELPVYTPAEPGVPSAEVRLKLGKSYATASTVLRADGNVYTGLSRISRSELTGKLVTDRLLQKIIKRSFYKAAVLHTGQKPVWGALTGIRPGKIVTGLLERGSSESAALKTLEREYFVTAERGELCLDTAKACLAVKKTLGTRDIALYIGIPFCPTRCHYCSFVSHSVEKSMKLVEPFLKTLLEEMKILYKTVKELGLNIISVYIGGGTPTTLSAGELSLFMGELAASFDLSRVREYTVEAGRPDTVTDEKLSALRQNGATRVSVNPQTMSDDVLRTIGRRHTAADVVTAFEKARRAGFDIINMDLIAGLPGDTPAGFKRSLEAVKALNPENITVHTLALKKGTKVTLEQMALPGAGEVADMIGTAWPALRSDDYSPYYLYRQKFMSGGFENIGWCRPGTESLYNILIMEELVTILALGGGGVTKLVSPADGKIERIFNLKYPYEYIKDTNRFNDKAYKLARFYAEHDGLV